MSRRMGDMAAALGSAAAAAAAVREEPRLLAMSEKALSSELFKVAQPESAGRLAGLR